MQGTFKLTPATPVPDDLSIAYSVTPLPISQIAANVGLRPDEIRLYGETKAKVKLSVIDRLRDEPLGKYVVVTAVSPTQFGEGKSTTTIGLAQMLSAHAGVKTLACIRQPSSGPIFGAKGGANGGGYSQVIPMDEFNLHLTGDIHAIGSANNLLAAAIDTRVLHEGNQNDKDLYDRLTDGLKDFTPTMITRLKKLGIDKTDPKSLTDEERVKFARLNIDPATITWRRVVDMNDRALREIEICRSKTEKGYERMTGFDITVASELMAILALCTDLADMRRRIGAMQVALSKTGESITCEDIGCAGAMTVLMKDTVEPTLMQHLEGGPCLVAAGPFANIAIGQSSCIADQMGLRLVGKDGYVLTEAGFGADIGGEKFMDMKCRTSGLKPDAAVIVATIRSMKYQSGIETNITTENLDALRAGSVNLLQHIENTHKFGVPVIVVLNRFTNDTPAEIALVKELCASKGVVDVVFGEHWAKGGAGLLEAATAFKKCPPSNFKFLYPSEMVLENKIRTIAKEIYRAADISLTDAVKAKLADFEARGYGRFPVCMAKTQYSFSHDAKLRGAPSGFIYPVRDVYVCVGAQFVVAIAGEISLMPGLITRPNYFSIDIDTTTGKVIGLS